MGKVFGVLALTSVAMASQYRGRRIQLRFRDPRTTEVVTHILERGAPRNMHHWPTYRLVGDKSGGDIQLVNYTSAGESKADQDGNVQSANAWALSIKSDKDKVNAQFDLGAFKPLNFASDQPQMFKGVLPACWENKHRNFERGFKLLYYINRITGEPWQKGDLKAYHKEGRTHWIVGSGRPGDEIFDRRKKRVFTTGRVFTEDLEVTISRCEEEAAPVSVAMESVAMESVAPESVAPESVEDFSWMLDDLPEVLDPQRGIVRRKDQVQPSSLLGTVVDQMTRVMTKELTKPKRRRLTAIDRESATAAHRRVLKRVRGH